MKNLCLNKNLQTSADLIKILGEPNRLKIVCLLKQNPLCVCEILAALQLPQNLVSHHLKTLLANGIVANKRNGKKIIYALNTRRLQSLSKKLHNILSL